MSFPGNQVQVLSPIIFLYAPAGLLQEREVAPNNNGEIKAKGHWHSIQDSLSQSQKQRQRRKKIYILFQETHKKQISPLKFTLITFIL